MFDLKIIELVRVVLHVLDVVSDNYQLSADDGLN